MRYGLGIDAGGTYTDAVVVDFSTKTVLAKGKALTTKRDLGIGISGVLDALPPELLARVELASLSTTLATNAIVEGVGNVVGALLLGFDAYDLAKIRHAPVRVVRGRTDIQGEELEPLDEEGLRAAVEDLERRERPDAYAVSGMVAVKNPAQELRAKELVAAMTGKPVVCGHEVSMQLNTIKRTNTAVLNARLLPVIAELLAKIKAVLGARGIDAPLMIVRADGTLMSEAAAAKHPVETILSGPAASVWGARFLTGVRDGLVVDIGGTTSDIALLIDGQPAVSATGASVADWETHVRAVDIDTVGLAGDSAVAVSRDRRLSLGPRRAVPLCVLGGGDPRVAEELERLWAARDRRSSLVQPVEFYRLGRRESGRELTVSEEEALETLRDGPLSRDRMAERMGVVDPSMVPVSRLETLGIVERSAATPTDMLHVRGVFSKWDAQAARLGARLVAHALRIDAEELPELVLETFTRQSAEHLVGRLLRQKGPAASTHGAQKEAVSDRGLLRLLLSAREHLGFSVVPRFRHPLVAVGAPAWALAPAVAERIGAELIVPEHADVANAVGAVTGTQSLAVEAVVSPKGARFLVHTPAERAEFKELDEAKEWARKRALELLEARIADEGGEGLEYHTEVRAQDSIAETLEGTIYLESIVRAVGVSRVAF